MASNLPVSAVVLAAGRSTRMGREKALLEIEGSPLWQRQRDVLANSGAVEIFLSARPDQRWAHEAKGFAAVLHDAMPGCGPIVGITAALERAAHPLVAVIAVDLPAMMPVWFQSLIAESTSDRGVVGRRGEFFEPLAAVYPREIIRLFWETLTRHEYSLQRVIAMAVDRGLLRVREISTEEERMFANWNEPGKHS
ncbi:MAG: molybdenum cofactor guanylyltransferase [Opitutaceae bacterium]